jgi:hypothetical protein
MYSYSRVRIVLGYLRSLWLHFYDLQDFVKISLDPYLHKHFKTEILEVFFELINVCYDILIEMNL